MAKPSTEEEKLLDRIAKSDIERGMDPKVIHLRQLLAQKAKREPKYRFYTLYNHICRKEVLQEAWRRVYQNGGSHGIDGIRFEDIIKENGVAKLLEEIHRELCDKTYKPRAVLRIHIPKGDGQRQRPLGIPRIKDRIIQMATHLIMEPIFEADFLECSHGFRPGIQAHEAVRKIEKAIKEGYQYIYDADMKSYFDTIPHNKLLACVRMRVTDKSVINLIRKWLKAPIVEPTNDKKHPTVTRPQQGTQQGGVISPLLSNIYLHWFDKVFHGKGNPVGNRAKLIRYADDFVVLTKMKSLEIEEFIRTKIEDWMELIINKEKTKIVNLAEKGTSIDFLGFNMRKAPSPYKRGKKYLRITPKKKAMEKVREKIKDLTSRKYNSKPVEGIIHRVNEYLQAWKGYFSIGHPYKAYGDIDYYVSKKMIAHLEKRGQRGYRRRKGESWYQVLRRLGLVRLSAKEVRSF